MQNQQMQFSSLKLRVYLQKTSSLNPLQKEL